MNTFTRINNKSRNFPGFTLLELLIVISIIAILSVALILVLNPSESLKKARDSQRMADLNTLKTALAVYLLSTTTPLLGGNTSNAACQAVAGTYATPNKMFYSLPRAGVTSSTTNATTIDATAAASLTPYQASTSVVSATDGTGWIPVNFNSLTSGTPISNLPIDPRNTIATLSAPTSTDLVYRYACAVSPLSFEVDAQLESTAFTVTDDKRVTDGGNSNLFFEVGTNLSIMGRSLNGGDF